jgi:hypothetical protein
MSERGEHGSFWLASTPDRICEGHLVSEGTKWILQVDGMLFDLESQPKEQQVGAYVMQTFGPTPGEDVRDSAPRVIHGRLDDGQKVTFFDAQQTANTRHIFRDRACTQRFEGWRALFGAIVKHINAPALGVRWTLPIYGCGWLAEGKTRCAGGVVTPWDHSGLSGLCLYVDQAHPIMSLADYTPPRISTLLTLACGKEIEPVRREVLLEDGNWYVFGADRPPSQNIRTDFIEVTQLGLETVCKWVDHSSRLGPLPFMVVGRSRAIQQEAQGLSAALEGLHRRLHDNEQPFAGVTKGGVRRAVAEAVRAGVTQLSKEGWEDDAFAQDRFQKSLNHVGQMTYAERLRALLGPVETFAPGLFGPDLDEWIELMKSVRNVQSHQLGEHDEFDEREISLYFVLTLSARWALRIAMLLPVLSSDVIVKALSRSIRFTYDLANMDNEGVWNGYSCLATYQAAQQARD